MAIFVPEILGSGVNEINIILMWIYTSPFISSSYPQNLGDIILCELWIIGRSVLPQHDCAASGGLLENYLLFLVLGQCHIC